MVGRNGIDWEGRWLLLKSLAIQAALVLMALLALYLLVRSCSVQVKIAPITTTTP